MRYQGVLLAGGIGWLLFGWPGLLVGSIAGLLLTAIHSVVRHSSGAWREQVAVSLAVTELAAKLARADGEVVAAERTVFSRHFPARANARRTITRQFADAARSPQGYEVAAMRLHRLLQNKPAMLKDIYQGLCAIAAADGPINAREQSCLRGIARHFGLRHVDASRAPAEPRVTFSSIDQTARKSRTFALDRSEANPFEVSADASVAQIRAARRRLAARYHPDRFVGKSVLEQQQAQEMMARINALAARQLAQRAKG